MGQVQRALGRRDTAGAHVVPVLVRPCVWDVDDGALAMLEPLPRNRKAVMSWPNHDEAWVEIVQGVRAVLAQSRDAAAPEPRVPNEVAVLEGQLQAARGRKEKLARVGAPEVARKKVEAEILE